MCLHSFCIRKMEGVHFNPPSPLSSSVLTPVKSLSHQVRQIAFQRLLPAANKESRAGQAAAGSRGRQQVPNTCGAPRFPPSLGPGRRWERKRVFLSSCSGWGWRNAASRQGAWRDGWMWGVVGVPGAEGSAGATPFGAAGEWVILGCTSKYSTVLTLANKEWWMHGRAKHPPCIQLRIPCGGYQDVLLHCAAT